VVVETIAGGGNVVAADDDKAVKAMTAGGDFRQVGEGRNDDGKAASCGDCVSVCGGELAAVFH